MSEVARYLNRATRGLWGEKKRDAQTELRGAIEDKIYRHRLLGLSETEATTAALRDLGSPAAIARELSEVHSMPQVFKTLLFVGVGTLLSLQALAQVTVVKSAYLTTDTVECRLQTAAELALMSADLRGRYDRIIAEQGGPEKFLAKCRSTDFGGLVLLKVADLLGALKAGGVRITEQAEVTPTTPLMTYTGENSTTPDASFITTEVQGGRYLASSMLIPFLKRATTLPLRLSGLTNPVLQVGDAKLQLGAGAVPVRTTDLLTAALIDQRRGNASYPLPVVMRSVPEANLFDPAAPRLAVPGQDGDVFAVVQNIGRVKGQDRDTLWVRARQGGTLQFTDEWNVQPRVVTSLDALDAATAQKQKAVLVYRLDLSNLRDLKLTPLGAAQVKVVKP